jgi:hypothetical protein
MRYKICIFILIMTVLFTGCSDAPVVSPTVPEEPDIEHDFSVYLAGTGDPIRLNTLIEDYEQDTGLDIEVITEQGDAVSDRTLWRMLNSQNELAVFTVDPATDIGRLAEAGFVTMKKEGTAIDKIKSATPIRFDTKGFVADRRLLAQLIGQDDPVQFISDLKLADYLEWRTFIIALDKYIVSGAVMDFKLNSRSYRFAAQKGELTAALTGIFAVSGTELSFIGRELLNRTLATTDPAEWIDAATELAAEEAAAAVSESAIEDTETAAGATPAAVGTTPAGASATPVAAATPAAYRQTEVAVGTSEEAIGTTGASVQPPESKAAKLIGNVFDAYTVALAEVTDELAGYYAPGIRGEDFINEAYYDREKATRIFTRGSAVFTDITDEQDVVKSVSAQSRPLVLFPVKIPYLECGLEPVIGGVIANSSVPVRVTGSLCVNERLSGNDLKQAQDFLKWFAKAENYGDDALMQEAADYYKHGDVLPYEQGDADYARKLTDFADAIADTGGLPVFLAEQDWNVDRLTELRRYLKVIWSNQVGT